MFGDSGPTIFFIKCLGHDDFGMKVLWLMTGIGEYTFGYSNRVYKISIFLGEVHNCIILWCGSHNSIDEFNRFIQWRLRVLGMTHRDVIIMSPRYFLNKLINTNYIRWFKRHR
jgi:hypothetical protein